MRQPKIHRYLIICVRLGALFYIPGGFSVTSTYPKPAQCVKLLADYIEKHRQTKSRSLHEIQEFRIATYNIENYDSYETLYEEGGKILQSPFSRKDNKSMGDRIGVAKKILEMNADVVVLQELKGNNFEDAQKALKQLTEDMLGGLYTFHVAPSNDGRGIHVAFLVKKDLPMHFELRTYADRLWTDPIKANNPRGVTSKLFSRDLPALIMRKTEGDAPALIMLGTHFKSKRDRPDDPESKVWRAAQVEESAKIVEELKKEFPDTPVMISGDFNGKPQEEAEFVALRNHPTIENARNLDRDVESSAETKTHFYFPRNLPADASEIDMHLVDRSLQPYILDAQAQSYYFNDGSEVPTPQSFDERQRLQPSDHRPVLLRLNANFMRLNQSHP